MSKVGRGYAPAVFEFYLFIVGNGLGYSVFYNAKKDTLRNFRRVVLFMEILK